VSEKDDPKRAVIARRIREARKSAGLSQGQVAKLMGLQHRPIISEIEAGKRRVTAEELSKHAELFDVTVAWLVGEAPESVETIDPRIQLAARELKKLKPEDLDRLIGFSRACARKTTRPIRTGANHENATDVRRIFRQVRADPKGHQGSGQGAVAGEARPDQPDLYFRFV
jgi:transcriptional regulator with XRE-family HTH domain